MASVFLSYSRKDQDFTRMLYDALAAAGRDAWVDWEGIPPSAKWLKEVYAGIDSADTFVFILSPDSLASEVCRLEAAHAIEGKKRIIPVVCREVSAPEVKAVEALAPLADINWIFFREHDDFKTSVEQLRFALDTDLDYWHLSSNLLVRAKRWEAGTKNANLTLRGLELAEAERWVTAGADKEPRPTALQLDYVSASRRARNQGQRRLLTGVSVALLVTIILSIVSTTLFQVTRVQNTQLQSRNAQLRAQVLAGQANNAILQNHQDQGLLLAVEATRRLEGSTEREALLTALESNPYLESVLQSDLTTQEAFPDVYGLAMSADGGTLIAATLEGHLSVWATQNWRLIAQFSTDPSLAGATLSPDGHIVATLGSTGLNLWDVATGARRAHLEDASATQVYLVFNSQNLAFSPDGTVLAAPECNDATCASVSFRLWDMQTNRVRTELLPAEPYHNRLGLTFSPDGTRLATSTGESVTLWDVQHGTPVAAFHPLASVRFQIVLALAFSPDGATLAISDRGQSAVPEAASAPGQVEFWDIRSGTANAAPLAQPAGPITAVAFDPHGQYIITATSSTLQTWDLATKAAVGPPFTGHTLSINLIVVTPDGRHIISGGSDGKALAWRRMPYTALGVPAAARADHVLFSADGSEMATWNNQQDALLVWNLVTGKTLVVLPHAAHGAHGWITGVAFSKDSRLLAVGGEDAHVTLWDTTRTVVTADLNLGLDALANGGQVTGVVFSPDGRYLVTATGGKNGAWMWDMATLSPVPDFRQSYTNLSVYSDVAISPDSQFAAVGFTDSASSESISLWSLRTHKVVKTIHALGGTSATSLRLLVFGHDASQLAALDSSGLITVWDALAGKRTLQVQAILTRATASTSASVYLAFRPDGRVLIIGDGTTITLWDVAANAPYVRPIVDPNGFSALVTSADGRYLAEAQRFGPVVIRYLTVEGWQAQACKMANRNLTPQEWAQFFGTEPYRSTCTAF